MEHTQKSFSRTANTKRRLGDAFTDKAKKKKRENISRTKNCICRSRSCHGSVFVLFCSPPSPLLANDEKFYEKGSKTIEKDFDDRFARRRCVPLSQTEQFAALDVTRPRMEPERDRTKHSIRFSDGNRIFYQNLAEITGIGEIVGPKANGGVESDRYRPRA